MSSPPPTIFELDGADRLTEANDGFWSFAGDNGWEPDPEAVLGSPIWRFIAGDGVLYLYRHLHRLAREQEKAFCFPLRCDSPSLRRDMTMTIAPKDHGGLVYIIELDRQIPLHEASSSTGLISTQLICPVCRRIEDEDDWLPLEEAITRQLLEVGERDIALHTCPDCCSPGMEHGVKTTAPH